MMKTIEGSKTGFVVGTIGGAFKSIWKDVPPFETNAARLLRTLKMMGGGGLTIGASVGVYLGVEQLVQNYRGKRDSYNGAIGGFVAGASVLGLKARCIPTGICSGAGLAITSVLIDSSGQTTRMDTSREYTVEKRAEADS